MKPPPPGRSVKQRGESSSFILMYHRIAESSSDPWQLCVSPGHFSEQLEVLRRHARVVPLGQLIRDIEGGLGAGVALTFDDGYADNLLVARPILERSDVRATMFITTGYVDRGREFWWDELDRVLLQAGELPATLYLTIDRAELRVELGEAARYSHEAARQHRYWRAYNDVPPGPRQAAYLMLWDHLVSLPEPGRTQLLDNLLEQTGVSRAQRASHRAMSREEVSTLASSGLIEIGAHTITHPALPALSLSAQRREIAGSRSELEDMVQGPVVGFAYPHGRYAPESVRLVQEAGFRYACAVRPDQCSPDLTMQRLDPYLLSRIPVLNWDGDTFQRQLLHGFHN